MLKVFQNTKWQLAKRFIFELILKSELRGKK